MDEIVGELGPDALDEVVDVLIGANEKGVIVCIQVNGRRRAVDVGAGENERVLHGDEGIRQTEVEGLDGVRVDLTDIEGETAAVAGAGFVDALVRTIDACGAHGSREGCE